MNNYLKYLDRLLEEMPEYSAIGVIQLIKIHIKYKSLLHSASQSSRQWEMLTCDLKKMDHMIEFEIGTMEEIITENRRRILFEKISHILEQNIRKLSFLVNSYNNVLH